MHVEWSVEIHILITKKKNQIYGSNSFPLILSKAHLPFIFILLVFSSVSFILFQASINNQKKKKEFSQFLTHYKLVYWCEYNWPQKLLKNTILDEKNENIYKNRIWNIANNKKIQTKILAKAKNVHKKTLCSFKLKKFICVRKLYRHTYIHSFTEGPTF